MTVGGLGWDKNQEIYHGRFVCGVVVVVVIVVEGFVVVVVGVAAHVYDVSNELVGHIERWFVEGLGTLMSLERS